MGSFPETYNDPKRRYHAACIIAYSEFSFILGSSNVIKRKVRIREL